MSERPSLGAGVQATIEVGADKGFHGKLSATGKVALWASEQVFVSVANGNVGLAAGAAAASMLAGIGYLTAKALAEQTTNLVIHSAAEVASNLGAMVPLVGGWLKIIVAAASHDRSEEEVRAACARSYRYVDNGTGPNNEILPCDLFLAASRTDAGAAAADGSDEPLAEYEAMVKKKYAAGLANFEWSNHADFSRLLTMLEEPAPKDAAARKAWPDAGIDSKTRGILRKLRLGMSAAYSNPWTGRRVSKDDTDGGACLWPLYADLLTWERRAGHVPREWLAWRMLAYDDLNGGPASGQGYGACKMAQLFAFQRGYLGADPYPILRSMVEQHKFDWSGCALWEQRHLDLWERMTEGWWDATHSPYSQFRAPRIAPQYSTGQGLPVLPYEAVNKIRLDPRLSRSQSSPVTVAAGAGILYAIARLLAGG